MQRIKNNKKNCMCTYVRAFEVILLWRKTVKVFLKITFFVKKTIYFNT